MQGQSCLLYFYAHARHLLEKKLNGKQMNEWKSTKMWAKEEKLLNALPPQSQQIFVTSEKMLLTLLETFESDPHRELGGGVWCLCSPPPTR